MNESSTKDDQRKGMSSKLNWGIAILVAVSVACGASTVPAHAAPSARAQSQDLGSSAFERELRREAGYNGREARASVLCGPFIGLCVRAAIAVATKVGSKIAARGTSRVKRVAKKAAKKRRVSFRRLQKSMRDTARNARKLRRSKAYRKKQWRKLARAIRRNIGRASRNCIIAGGATLLGSGNVRAAIFACVGAFASALASSSSARSPSVGTPVGASPAHPRDG